MKKSFFLALLAIVSVSCLNRSKFYSSQTLLVDFDLFNGTSVFSEENPEAYSGTFYVGPFYFYAKLSEDEQKPELSGGVSLCRAADTTIFTRTSPFSHFAAFGEPCKEEDVNTANVHVTYFDAPDADDNPQYALSYVYQEMGYAMPKSVDVNNTLEMYAAVIGENTLPAFQGGDWVKVVFTGCKDGKETADVEAFLVDYTGAKAKIVTEWSTVDLSALGSVDGLKIHVKSNVEGIPRYVCLDNIVTVVVVGEEEKK